MRLKEANYGFVDRLRLLPQVMDFKPDQRRCPVQRFRDTGHLPQILFAYRRYHPGDLQRKRGVDAGYARYDDIRLAIDIGKIHIMIETTPAQRVGELAGAIGCEHYARDRSRFNSAKLRNADLKIRKQFQQESLELLV